MKITKHESPVVCPDCKVGMNHGKPKTLYEFGDEFGGILGHGACMDIPNVYVFRCPKCFKEWDVDFSTDTKTGR